MREGNTRLTIVAGRDGRYSYELDDGGAVGSGGQGLNWGALKEVISGLAPKVSCGTHLQAAEAVSETTDVKTPERPASPDVQALRLECARLVVQAGVSADRVIGQAAAISEWISRRHP